MSTTQHRLILLSAGFFCWLLIAFAYFYLENTLYLSPCPLCMMQRLAFALIGSAFILEAILWSKRPSVQFMMKLLKYFSIFFGILLASRHLYIQSLPADQVPACGLDFYGLMAQNSILSALWQAMQGSGDCATKDDWLGLTIPLWSMIIYLLLLFVAIFTQRPKN